MKEFGGRTFTHRHGNAVGIQNDTSLSCCPLNVLEVHGSITKENSEIPRWDLKVNFICNLSFIRFLVSLILIRPHLYFACGINSVVKEVKTRTGFAFSSPVIERLKVRMLGKARRTISQIVGSR